MKWKRIWISLWLLTLLAIFIVILINHSPYFLLESLILVTFLIKKMINKYLKNNKKNSKSKNSNSNISVLTLNKNNISYILANNVNQRKKYSLKQNLEKFKQILILKDLV